MFIKNFNYYLKIYLVFLLIIGTYYLFQKYNNPVEYTISEWLINYQGGFTRRGFIGEIIFQTTKIINLSFRETILLFQISSYILYFFLFYKLVKKINVDIILFFAIFSPIFLSYPFSEVEVLARKEIFIFILFLINIHIFFYIKNSTINKLVLSTSLVVLILIWEGVVFFIHYFLFIIIIKNNFKINKKLIFEIICVSIPGLIAIYCVTFFKLSPDELGTMCKSFNEACYNAINFLNWPLSAAMGEVKTQFQFSYFLRYFFVFIIGFFPLFLVIRNTKISKSNNFFIKHEVLFFYLILIFLTLPIYFIAKDWARWISITYSLTIISFLGCLKNNLLTYKYLQFTKKFFFNKTIITFIFIIFCFGWSPKTLINDDISSIPLYRKSVKILENLI